MIRFGSFLELGFVSSFRVEVWYWVFVNVWFKLSLLFYFFFCCKSGEVKIDIRIVGR